MNEIDQTDQTDQINEKDENSEKCRHDTLGSLTPGAIRSFLDLEERVKPKIGQRVLFGFTSPQLSFIETVRYF
jgi:hypothetical protein